MHEGIPEQPSKGVNEQPNPSNLSRRRFLVGGAALVGATLAGSYVFKEITGGDESIVEEKPPFPSPEKIQELELARRKIRACVESIQNRPYMEKPRKAKEGLGKVEVKPDYTSVALGLEEGGEIRTMHIQDIQELSKQLRNGKGTGVYVHREGDSRYHITLEDTSVDVGVSNRFIVKKHLGKGSLSESLPVYGVKRSRYEKKQVTHQVVNKKGKVEKVNEITGEYVEYVTYVPPGFHLVNKEVVGSGKEYVSVVLEAAHEVLSHRMTKSNQKVLKICHDICKKLAIVEHVDPIAIIRAEKKEGNETDFQVEARKKSLYQKMYAEYGLNQDASFNHLINFLGAGGMMQIMRKTYDDIRTRLIVRKIFLPDEIPEDANEGRRNPLISAVIAMYLCYDNYLVKGKVLAGMRDDEVELALVSMYNGSPNLLRKILKDEDSKKETKVKKAIKAIKGNKNIPKVPVPVHNPVTVYPNATPFIQKLLTHNEGIKLPGSGESENRNYIRKYVWLKLNEKGV